VYVKEVTWGENGGKEKEVVLGGFIKKRKISERNVSGNRKKKRSGVFQRKQSSQEYESMAGNPWEWKKKEIRRLSGTVSHDQKNNNLGWKRLIKLFMPEAPAFMEKNQQ